MDDWKCWCCQRLRRICGCDLYFEKNGGAGEFCARHQRSHLTNHAFKTDGTARNRCVFNYPNGKQCRRGNSASVHRAEGR